MAVLCTLCLGVGVEDDVTLFVWLLCSAGSPLFNDDGTSVPVCLGALSIVSHLLYPSTQRFLHIASSIHGVIAGELQFADT